MAEEIVVEMSEVLENVAHYAFQEAQEKLEQGGDFVPFTVLSDGESMFIETHPGETVDECFESAQNTIALANNDIECYVFCYDGYVEADEGTQDAIIVECAERASEDASILCKVYALDGELFAFEENVGFLGEADNYFDDVVENEDDEDEDEDEESEAVETHTHSCSCGCGD